MDKRDYWSRWPLVYKCKGNFSMLFIVPLGENFSQALIFRSAPALGVRISSLFISAAAAALTFSCPYKAERRVWSSWTREITGAVGKTSLFSVLFHARLLLLLIKINRTSRSQGNRKEESPQHIRATCATGRALLLFSIGPC